MSAHAVRKKAPRLFVMQMLPAIEATNRSISIGVVTKTKKTVCFSFCLLCLNAIHLHKAPPAGKEKKCVISLVLFLVTAAWSL